ncbi:hypothetical protein OLMES_0496 [Oleiphilus messinensis]|uniref:Lipoprotein n=2 Tax=Oleiphilus messinensis TaxID=141451 RepID=A0A1Y0I314_9GAMM|nr:hypothetical protein OLMES_0496 [Oleiphilus messinensis]
MKRLPLYLLFAAIFLFSGCNDVETVKHKLEAIAASTNGENEHQHVTSFQEYASENNLPYVLEVSSGNQQINVSDISHHLNEPLTVKIKITGQSPEFTWHPKKNENIFILLRE